MNIFEQLKYNFSQHIYLIVIPECDLKEISPKVYVSNAPRIIGMLLDKEPEEVAEDIIKNFKHDLIDKMEYKNGKLYAYLK